MTQEAVYIKGTKDGLVIILNPAYNFEELKNGLQEKIISAKGFFMGAKFTLMGDKINKNETEILEEICLEHGLIPNNTIEFPKEVPVIAKDIEPKKEETFKEDIPKDASNCLLLNHSIRSGQTIQYDGHLTILGDVNGGAELIAEGNILVMGALRGVAHAGVTGNTKAVIVAHRMEAEQLRIFKTLARSTSDSESRKYPEIARLENNRIILEPYTTAIIGPKKKQALLF